VNTNADENDRSFTLRTLTPDSLSSSGVRGHVKKWDFLTLVGTNMTRNPKKNKAQHKEKDREELRIRRKRRNVSLWHIKIFFIEAMYVKYQFV